MAFPPVWPPGVTMIVTVTVAPLPSLTMSVKLSVPVKPAFGMYTTLPLFSAAVP